MWALLIFKIVGISGLVGRLHNSIKWSCAWQLHAHVLVSASWACSWIFHEHRCSWEPHEHAHEGFTSTLKTLCKSVFVFIFSGFLFKDLGLDSSQMVFWMLGLQIIKIFLSFYLLTIIWCYILTQRALVWDNPVPVEYWWWSYWH